MDIPTIPSSASDDVRAAQREAVLQIIRSLEFRWARSKLLQGSPQVIGCSCHNSPVQVNFSDDNASTPNSFYLHKRSSIDAEFAPPRAPESTMILRRHEASTFSANGEQRPDRSAIECAEELQLGPSD
jgi:hypothetical protein